jgi:sugar O-acyltransferase (sialic acid O-acetyltransferase NeuD family)
MSFKTVTAPHINVNDLEMIMQKWYVSPWQLVEQGDVICDVETTKAIVTVESEYSGYVYPLVPLDKVIKVGEPLAHVFPEDDPKQLEELNRVTKEEVGVTTTKKALVLMKEHGLTVADFPKFSMISSETVVAKLRERQISEKNHGEPGGIDIDEKNIRIDQDSVVIYGEPNQALLALDALNAAGRYNTIAYLNSSYDKDNFYGLPVLHNTVLKYLRARGLGFVYICGQNSETLARQQKECEDIGIETVLAVHPSSSIASTALLGKGVFIGANVVIGPDVKIGEFSRILCGATVAHHSLLGKFISVSDGSHIGGNVVVGDETLIGIGVNINKRVTIGNKVVIVSGAVVTDHIPDNHIVRLNPDYVQIAPSVHK